VKGCNRRKERKEKRKQPDRSGKWENVMGEKKLLVEGIAVTCF